MYVAEVVTLLCGYPLWAGERAVKHVRESVKFVPSLAEIKPVLEDQVRAHRYAAEWERGAQENRKHLAGPDFSEPAYRERMLQKFEGLAAELRTANPRLKPEKTPAEIKAELIKQIGQEAFDAIPDWHGFQTVHEAGTEALKQVRKAKEAAGAALSAKEPV